MAQTANSVVALHQRAEHAPSTDRVSGLLDWPAPPFYEVLDASPNAAETALVQFRDGRRLNGEVMRFAPATGLIEFCPERAAGASLLALSDLIELRLTRPVRLKRRAPAFVAGAGSTAGTNAPQAFRIELVNGTVLEGETCGFQVHSIGLFLYVHSHAEHVLRTFVPTMAVRTKQIGPRLGEILVADKKVTATQIDQALENQSTQRLQKIGEYLVDAQISSEGDVLEALKRQRAMPMLRLGEALLQTGAITQGQLESALEKQKTERTKPLGALLIELGSITRDDLTRAMNQKLGIPFIDLQGFQINRRVLDLVPRAVAMEHNVLPVCMDGNSLVVAVENPLDPVPLDRIRFLLSRPVTAVMASGDEIRAAIARQFVDVTDDGSIEEIAAELQVMDGRDDSVEEENVGAENDHALVRLVNRMIADAQAANASDIHIETNGASRPLKVRFRQDGVMREYLSLPPSYRRSLVSRIKIMAGLDISERRRGQDGKIRLQDRGRAPLELRVATIPTRDGREDVVLRLLASGEPIPLAKAGFAPAIHDRVRELIARPHGILIVCGPTGSGKTTTLHSLLGHINRPGLKIWTAEDPVEIQQEGLRQVQVNPKGGWTFATAMRSFLRADPDVIMVGEMRDQETAQIAIDASLTGHLVFSTLHTNSAPESVVRLLDMGVEPFNFADSLLGVLAQRLARRVCEKCRVVEPLSDADSRALVLEYCGQTPLDPDAQLANWRSRFGSLARVHAPGCEHCRGSGYRGRLGIHEFFVNSPEVTRLILRRADAHELRTAAVSTGMRTLKQDGIEKCLEGLTNLQEVRAVCG